MPTINLKAWSDDELDGLKVQIDEELRSRVEDRKKEAIEKMRAAAAEVGMTAEELLGIGGGGKRKRARRESVAWVHPDDPKLIYRGGRKPNWLVALKKEGRDAVKVE